MKINVPTDLWKRVEMGGPDECWPWLGATTPNGYGIISINYRNRGTHRLAYELATGVAPGELFVCHTCDNPPCCNPAHLYLGTPKDNTRDMHERGRCRAPRGSQHHAAKLTEAAVLAIRRRRAAGERATDLAVEFAVSKPTITRVVKNEGWVHV